MKVFECGMDQWHNHVSSVAYCLDVRGSSNKGLRFFTSSLSSSLLESSGWSPHDLLPPFVWVRQGDEQIRQALAENEANVVAASGVHTVVYLILSFCDIYRFGPTGHDGRRVI